MDDHSMRRRSMQCLAPTYSGEYHLKGSELRKSGMNRIGNMLVPNDNYCKFEEWLMPILDSMLKEQQDYGTTWTPSKVIAMMYHTGNIRLALQCLYKHAVP